MFRLRQTRLDGSRAFSQVSGSPLDSLRLGSIYRIRMACKRSGVQIPIAPRRSGGFFAHLSDPFERRTAAKYRSSRSGRFESARRAVAPVPSLATLYRVLAPNTLIVPGQHPLPRSSYVRWERQEPMELWHRPCSLFGHDESAG